MSDLISEARSNAQTLDRWRQPSLATLLRDLADALERSQAEADEARTKFDQAAQRFLADVERLCEANKADVFRFAATVERLRRERDRLFCDIASAETVDYARWVMGDGIKPCAGSIEALAEHDREMEGENG